MNKICFISVYFGEIPAFMELFFQSCSWNKDYDWLIVTDNAEKITNKGSNIKLLSMTKDEFHQRLNNVVGWKVPNFKPYKVCDFRPAFGEVFRTELQGYDFWGISDTDMILGNLSSFIKEDLLVQYDKIYTQGHLSIIRNTDSINAAYKVDTSNSRDYKRVFNNPNSCIFDEYEGFTEKIEDLGYKVYKYRDCADVYFEGKRIKVCDRRRFRLIQSRNSFHDFCTDVNFRYQIFTINKGKIIKYFIKQGRVESKEYSYIHKIEHNTKYEISAEDKFVITVDGLVKDDTFFKDIEQGLFSINDFKKYNRPNVMHEKMHFLYLFYRLGIRNIRKRYFPREDEI